MVLLPAVRMGRSFSSATVTGLPLMSTSYSYGPIFDVPPGKIRFWALMALTTSSGDSPRACSAAMSRSTCTWRCLPPYGYGMAAPSTVTRRVRMKLSA